MDRTTIAIDPSALRLRRVGRLARRRMRIDGPSLSNGLHTDGTLTVQISGLGSPVAGIPDSFEWEADRPIALVIVRSGIDGEDVAFQVGPSRFGIGGGPTVSDGAGIQYIAFCYDAAPAAVGVAVARPAALTEPPELPTAAAAASDTGARRRSAAFQAAVPTRRERRSILDQILRGGIVRRATT
jgi:hypothetical protein